MEEQEHPTIYWAAYRIAPTKKGMWRTGFKEFTDEAARDRFVKNTKYQVTETGER